MITASPRRAPIEPVHFDYREASEASESWGFNCGPAAICAVSGLRPHQVRQHLGDFENKRYTNPTLMFAALQRAGVEHCQVYRADDPTGPWPDLALGLVRIQWGGPWTGEGVPMAARYRYTHWIAVRASGYEVFDVNAIAYGGWLGWREWADDPGDLALW